MNKRRKVVIALGAMLLSLSFPLDAQQLAKVFRIGVLLTGSASTQKSRIRIALMALHAASSASLAASAL